MAVGNYQPLTLTPINFSLTEGTSIPAPPDSPDSPRPPTPGRGPLDSHPTPTKNYFSSSVNRTTSTEQLRKTTSTDDHSSQLTPASPNGSNSNSKRPNSVRKFLGLHTMSSSDSLGSDRPGSPPSTAGSKPGLQRKKSSSWFSRRKSSFMMGPVSEGTEKPAPVAAQQRSVSSGHYATPASPPPSRPTTQKKALPPPALPALSSFGVTEKTTSLDADDIFKNIK